MTQTAPDPEVEEEQQEQGFLFHLLELRDRLLRMVLAVVAVFLCLVPFANDIYLWVAGPMMSALPENTSMIATQVAAPFLTPFKLALMAAVFFSMPYLLYQFWAFVAPGLYRHERRFALPLLASSILLFYLGAAFAYFVVFPLVFAFLTGIAPEGIPVMPDITHYLDFVIALFFAFGLAFEVPIATILLVWVGITTPEQLARKRPYIIVVAFVLGMFLTPPDVISQTLLALPMWVLFELGVILSKAFVRDDSPDQEVDEPEAEAAGFEPETAPAASTDFTPLTEAQMDTELDRIEAGEVSTVADDAAKLHDPVDAKIAAVNALREQMETDKAIALCRQIIEEGNPDQVRVAENILAQLTGDD